MELQTDSRIFYKHSKSIFFDLQELFVFLDKYGTCPI